MSSFLQRGGGEGIDFPHPRAFWAGACAVAAGVSLHLPMYLGAAHVHYRLAGMSPDAPMLIGMALIVGGLPAAAYGLLGRRAAAEPQARGLSVRALDDAPLALAHVVLLAVLAIAITIDAMKPITLGFVLPGMAKEYGLRSALNPHGSPPVALLPVFGLAGTLVGSLAWGRLGDLVGRRASILLAGLLFVATSICGAMPSYQWNFAMCFIMGLGVGGMIPITLTLIAELLPKRHRGWAMVLIGGEIALAYVITSSLSSALAPTYGWRIMWLLGLPTGVLLIALQRFIPESPRYLLLRGRASESAAVMKRYGVETVAGEPGAGARASPEARPTWRSHAALASTTIMVLLALAAGLVTYGFQLWIPTNLQRLGFSQVTSASFLRDSALIGLPVTVAFAALYAVWSTRGTMLVLAIMTAAALIGFVVAGDGVVKHHALLHVLLAVPTTAINSVLAAVLAYVAEVYPTSIRASASGVAAGLSKAGGVALTVLVAAAVAPPSIRNTALLGAVPLLLGAVAVALWGLETRSRSLEDIGASRVVATREAVAAHEMR